MTYMSESEKIIYDHPWESLTPITRYERLKMALATVTLVAPLRVLIIYALLLTGVLVLMIIPPDGRTRPTRVSSKLTRLIRRSILRFGTRLILFIAGFLYVFKEGDYDSRARVIISTHHSLWDSLWLIWYTGASQTAKAELFDSPIIGMFLNALESVPVDRHSSHGRRSAAQAIRDRAVDTTTPPLLIFPAGCCSNCRQLIEFKRGGFNAGIPLQPVGIAYLARHADLCLSQHTFWDLYRTVCQPVNHMAVTFLPVRYPSAEESQNPRLWSDNVRHEMSLKLGMELVNYSTETELIRVRCRDAGIVFNELKCRVHDLNLAHRLVDEFKALDGGGDGVLCAKDLSPFINAANFSRLLGIVKLPPIPAELYSTPRMEENAWTEQTTIGLITGGRPRLKPRPIDPYYPACMEFCEILSYFNNIIDLKICPDRGLVDLFRVSNFV